MSKRFYKLGNLAMERTWPNQEDAEARGHRVLCAYFAATGGQIPSGEELGHLSALVYMPPSAVRKWYTTLTLPTITIKEPVLRDELAVLPAMTSPTESHPWQSYLALPEDLRSLEAFDEHLKPDIEVVSRRSVTALAKREGRSRQSVTSTSTMGGSQGNETPV